MAIYGYTIVYRFTKEQRFLDHAQKVTDIYLKRLKETSDDWVPIWDMDDPRGQKAPKDASAACVVASALLQVIIPLAARLTPVSSMPTIII